MTQITDKTTNVTSTCSALLDLAITNKPDAACSCDVPQEVAYHDLISIVTYISKPKRLPVIRTFRHDGDYTKEKVSFSLLQRKDSFNMILSTNYLTTN